ncbi:MAG: hypothetical protein JSW28_02375 [Thermoplasmata archaeon]|nr:MAG: hypothetical protein JSW28_02375 [Thermoplasmata archaeon]
MKKIKYHPRVGHSKTKELYVKNTTALRLLEIDGPQKGVRDLVQGGIVREFIEQYLPKGCEVGRGFVYDLRMKKHSPEIDAIVYKGPPLIRYGDFVITDKGQTLLMVEVKHMARKGDIFGKSLKDRKGKTLKGKDGAPLRDSKTDFQVLYRERRNFGYQYVLFVFAMEISQKIPDEDIKKGFYKMSDIWVVVWRKKGKKKSFDYENSVSKFIETLRNCGKWSRKEEILT